MFGNGHLSLISAPRMSTPVTPRTVRICSQLSLSMPRGVPRRLLLYASTRQRQARQMTAVAFLTRNHGRAYPVSESVFKLMWNRS